MNSFRYEVHTHTNEVSSCGCVDAAVAVQMHKKAGYQGIIITDHFHEEYFESLGSISWEEKVDCYLSGYKKAAEEGQKIDMDILWGLELRFTENDNDYLVYGVDEKFLKENPDFYKSSLIDFMKHIKQREDILIFQAHPFRDGCKLADPLIVHGLEVYNGNSRHDSRNELAAKVAFENNLLVISGSDFHRPEDLAKSGILLPERISTNRELIKFLKKNQWDFLITKENVSNIKEYTEI